MKEKRRKLIEDQLTLYKERFLIFTQFTGILNEALNRIGKQISADYIVQARVKTLSSFADKILRQTNFKNPIEEFTDICAARIILPTLSEVKKVSKLIEANFIINTDLSCDKTEILDVSEFGYTSTHFSIKLKPGVSLYKDLNIQEFLYTIKGELQVRTINQHAWATIYHNIGFKGKYKLKEQWDREFHRLAALLEEVDESFFRIKLILREYESNYRKYLTTKQISDKMERLQIIFEADTENADIAHEIAKMAMNLGNWGLVIEILSKFVEQKNVPLLRDLGISMLKFYPKGSKENNQGKLYLEKAIELDPTDFDALASLGGYYKKLDEDKARECYRRAFEINPFDPYSLGNYLIYEIRKLKNLDPIIISQPTIKAAIERCDVHIDLDINIPWAFFDKGLFNLFLGNFQESFDSYLLGIKFCSDSWIITTTLKTLDLLKDVHEKLTGVLIIERILLLCLVYKFDNKAVSERLNSSISSKKNKIISPVVILVGTTKFQDEETIRKYQKSIITAFNNFEGTIISGGTLAGISAIAGEIQSLYPTKITTIGYIPKDIPDNVKVDSRYKIIQKTNGLGFSIEEAIYYWSDIWANNIDSKEIKVLGVGGGGVSAFEYRLALIFNVKLGLLENCGQEAEFLIHDPKWIDFQQGKKPQIKLLTNSKEEIEKFIKN